MGHARAHDAESENCNAWFCHGFTHHDRTHHVSLIMLHSSQRDDANKNWFRFVYTHRVSQRAAVTLDGDLHDISVLQANMVAKTEAVRSKEMNVDVSRPAVSFKLKMMMLNVAQAVAHLGFPGAESLGPVNISISLDRRRNGNGFEFRINHELGSQRAGTEFRTREVLHVRTMRCRCPCGTTREEFRCLLRVGCRLRLPNGTFSCCRSDPP